MNAKARMKNENNRLYLHDSNSNYCCNKFFCDGDGMTESTELLLYMKGAANGAIVIIMLTALCAMPFVTAAVSLFIWRKMTEWAWKIYDRSDL